MKNVRTHTHTYTYTHTHTHTHTHMQEEQYTHWSPYRPGRRCHNHPYLCWLHLPSFPALRDVGGLARPTLGHTDISTTIEKKERKKERKKENKNTTEDIDTISTGPPFHHGSYSGLSLSRVVHRLTTMGQSISNSRIVCRRGEGDVLFLVSSRNYVWARAMKTSGLLRSIEALNVKGFSPQD